MYVNYGNLPGVFVHNCNPNMWKWRQKNLRFSASLGCIEMHVSITQKEKEIVGIHLIDLIFSTKYED
jgi:hypothetical protein